MTVGVLHPLPIKGINLILWNHLAGEKVTAVPYTLNSLEEITDNTDEVIVYPACAVTRPMAKDAQVARGESQSLGKISVTEKDGGDKLKLANSFIVYDRELIPEQHEPD